MPTAHSDASSMCIRPVDVALCCPRTPATSPARARSVSSSPWTAPPPHNTWCAAACKQQLSFLT
eukprot:3474133-Prymnesium_polylepis.1